MKAMTPSVRPCFLRSFPKLLALWLVGTSGLALWADTPQNLDGNLTLKPSKPSATWPEPGQDQRLSPKFTARIVVQVQEEEKVNGVNYKIKPGASATAECADSNVLLVGPGSGVDGTWILTNTSADEVTAQVRA